MKEQQTAEESNLEKSIELLRYAIENCDLSNKTALLVTLSKVEKYSSTPQPTSPVTEEQIKNFIESYFKSTEGSPNNIRDAIIKTIEWMRDLQPTSPVSDEEIEKESKKRVSPNEVYLDRKNFEYYFQQGAKWHRDLPKSQEREWISVKDRLPDVFTGHFIVCLKNDAVMELVYSKHHTMKWYSLFSKGYNLEMVIIKHKNLLKKHLKYGIRI